MGIMLVLLAYIYDPADWQHYPDFNEIRNFTADAFHTVYAVTSNAILELDEQSNLPGKVYTSGQRLPTPIHLALFDNDRHYFWIATEQNLLYTFPVIGGFPSRIPVSNNGSVERIGLDEKYVYFDFGSAVTAINKYTQSEEQASPGGNVTWVYSAPTSDIRDKYPFLAPWFITDIEMYPFNRVFLHRTKAYVSAPGYGYIVYSTQGWQELTRYRGLKTTGVHSLFTTDGSLYAVGLNGISELSFDEETFVFHRFDNWGTTKYETPIWSKGAYSKLRRINFHKFRLIDDYLFLLEGEDAYVLNIPSGKLSDIVTNRWIYDVDFHEDTLFFATDEGVFYTSLPDEIPTPLSDERTKLTADDVYGIVRGEGARYFWTGRMLVKQSPEGWKYYTRPSYLPAPQEAIAGRDSLIILGGEDGLVIYNPEDYFERRLTKEEGLLSNKVTALHLQDDYLWIATDAGLQRFDLNAVLP
ncbi:hypothetical protein GF359_00760 [candidate division WOR-3 bacterium]|uniref:Uncharacterized protein n=1 Tax=candidate division WOR-3 bacterium TaxID=2052148 RepID=A0A9D5K8U8_UNCW3|nr:hypothetical protein [candidate division WOR-3 bacterium]MBD3363724.1 hypothetical protein [candidate division WOR-3 bacterium]